MEYEKDLFKRNKVNAPNDFVKNTMKHINLKEIEEQEKKVVKIEYSFFRIGQICIVTAMLLIILNIFPATENAYGNGFKYKPLSESIIQKASNAFDGIIDDVNEYIDWGNSENNKEN